MTQREKDIQAARHMLRQSPQASVSQEADDQFAALVGATVETVEQEDRLHRRRIAALRELVRSGEAWADWMGIGSDGGWHGARRSRVYTLYKSHQS